MGLKGNKRWGTLPFSYYRQGVGEKMDWSRLRLVGRDQLVVGVIIGLTDGETGASSVSR